MIKKLLLILLLCSVCQAAQIIRYVDPDVVAGDGSGDSWTNAYASLFAWEAAEETDLDAANNYMTVYCRSSAGTADTATCIIAGWATSATDYIEIIGSDFPSDGIWDATKYVIHDNNATLSAIEVHELYVKIINLQVLLTTTTGTKYGILVWGDGDNSTVDSCFVKGICSGTGAAWGIQYTNTSTPNVIYNTVVSGFKSGTDNNFGGIFATSSSGVTIYNSTVTGCRTGVNSAGGTIAMYNCALGLNDYTEYLVGTIDYCCSTDGVGTNAQTPLDGDWAKEWTASGSNDFSLLVGGNCVGNGTDNPGSGLYSDDIIGTSRTTVWDIGAFEYTAGAPAAAGGQLIMIQEF